MSCVTIPKQCHIVTFTSLPKCIYKTNDEAHTATLVTGKNYSRSSFCGSAHVYFIHSCIPISGDVAQWKKRSQTIKIHSGSSVYVYIFRASACNLIVVAFKAFTG